MIERSWIFPSFPKREIKFTHGRSSNFELDVVPRGSRSIPRVQLDGLDVPTVAVVITTSVTEIDASDKRHVVINTRRMTDDDHFLMVRSPSAYSFIEQHFASRLGHFNGESSILLRIKSKAVTVRAPEQTSNVDASSTRVRQEGRNRYPVAGYHFVGVAAPVGKTYLVPWLQARDALIESGEIRDPINMERDEVAFGPSQSEMLRVNLGRWVAPLLRSKEPVVIRASRTGS
jgi:hypothetical protein